MNDAKKAARAEAWGEGYNAGADGSPEAWPDADTLPDYEAGYIAGTQDREDAPPVPYVHLFGLDGCELARSGKVPDSRLKTFHEIKRGGITCPECLTQYPSKVERLRRDRERRTRARQ